MANIIPPSITSDTAPSLQDAPLGYTQDKTGLVDREPAMTSGTAASLTVLATSVALVIKHAYGIEIGDEVISSVVDAVLVLINFIVPLLAAKFTRERVSPVA